MRYGFVVPGSVSRLPGRYEERTPFRDVAWSTGHMAST